MVYKLKKCMHSLKPSLKQQYKKLNQFLTKIRIIEVILIIVSNFKMLKWLICLFALIYGKYIDSAKEQDGERVKDTTKKLI